MIEPKTLPGFMELLPQDQILFNKIAFIIETNTIIIIFKDKLCVLLTNVKNPFTKIICTK